MKKITICILFMSLINNINSQSKGDWFHIPGFDPALHTTLTNRSTFIGVISLAVLSYSLEEFILKKHENINYYTSRIGMSNEYAWGLKNVLYQNFGIEHRVASWFSISAEFNLQEWHDQTPMIDNKDKFGLGIGLMILALRYKSNSVSSL